MNFPKLGTRHVDVNHYLAKVGKRESPECECRIEDQTVDHVLMRCVLVEEARMANRGEWEECEEEGLKRLLYTDEGIRRAMKIWE